MTWRILFLCLLFSCSERKSTLSAIDLDKTNTTDSLLNVVKGYSLSRNPYRTIHHAPLLPDSFVLVNYGMDYAAWQVPNLQRTPVYSNMTITWTLDSLYSERNYFLGPNKETLIIWYGMDMDDNMQPRRPGYHFSCSFRSNIDTARFNISDSLRDSAGISYIQVEPTHVSHNISIEMADSILRSWKINVH